MEGKGGFFVLIVIVAFLSLAIALLVGYVFIVSGSDHEGKTVIVNGSGEVFPKDDELGYQSLLGEKTNFNLKSEAGKLAIIQIDGEMSYYLEVKGIKDVSAKIGLYKNEIKELVGTYFQGLTLEDVKSPDAKEKAKKVLVKQINDLLNRNEDQKRDIIYNIVFTNWFYQ